MEDRGPGIPAEQREAVFEPFHQLERTHHSPGTGVGLALVRRFAELHGGRAWVEEPPAGGSRFCATLPEDPDVTR